MEVPVEPTLRRTARVAPPADLELIDEFVANSELNEQTLHKYRRHLLEFHAWLEARAGGRRLIEVEKADIKLFLADLSAGRRHGLSADGRPLTGPLSPSARKSVISALRAFYEHCVDLYGLAPDPTYRIKAPKVKLNPGKALTEKELRYILDAPGSERDRVQAYLKVYTAARSGSLRQLRWQEVDFEQNVIHFNAKFDSHYTLPIHPQLRAALIRWAEAVEQLRRRRPLMDQALDDPDTAYVLMTYNGQPLCHSTIAKQAKWRAARVGVRRHRLGAPVSAENKSEVSPHWFRRSFAQIQRSRGVPLADIADVLAHKDLNTTRLHYAHTDTPRLRKTVTSFKV
jgi:integrase/recombinase XerD